VFVFLVERVRGGEAEVLPPALLNYVMNGIISAMELPPLIILQSLWFFLSLFVPFDKRVTQRLEQIEMQRDQDLTRLAELVAANSE